MLALLLQFVESFPLLFPGTFAPSGAVCAISTRSFLGSCPLRPARFLCGLILKAFASLFLRAVSVSQSGQQWLDFLLFRYQSTGESSSFHGNRGTELLGECDDCLMVKDFAACRCVHRARNVDVSLCQIVLILLEHG